MARNEEEAFRELTHLKTKSLRPSPSIHNQNKRAINPGEVLVRTNPPTEKTKQTEAAVNFDKPARIDSILHSAGKDRAKIPIKRRPQSRQARQEALRKDPSEDYVFDDSTLTFPKNSDSSTLEVVVEDFTDSIKKKNDFEATQVSLMPLDNTKSTKTKPRTSPTIVKGLIPAQHEIDSLMEIHSGSKLNECIDHDITKSIVNSTISSFGRESSTSLFGDDTPESDDLFSSFTIPKKKSGEIQTKEKNKLSIFDEYDGEDIFSSPSQFESLAVVSAKHSGNSSFLLDVKSDTAKPSLTHKKSQSKTVRIQPLSRVTKTESDDKFEDPLMAMKK
uniref:FAM21/CAPZIP domain-containing protein n=1 Tax=Timema monikensis TaxID=170555 RepID=A0A7R9EC60_9NEOP|nr:unnamed protein product [Timema monikensis]